MLLMTFVILNIFPVFSPPDPCFLSGAGDGVESADFASTGD